MALPLLRRRLPLAHRLAWSAGRFICPPDRVGRTDVESAEQMLEAVMERVADTDIFIEWQRSQIIGRPQLKRKKSRKMRTA